MMTDRVQILEDDRANEGLLTQVQELAEKYRFDAVEVQVRPAGLSRMVRLRLKDGRRKITFVCFLREAVFSGAAVLAFIETNLELWHRSKKICLMR